MLLLLCFCFSPSCRIVTRTIADLLAGFSTLWIQEDAWTHCRNCCGDVRERMLKSSSRGFGQDIARFTIHPEATLPSSYTFVARRCQPLNRSYFIKSALRFLRDVAVERRKSQGERSDVAIWLRWVIDDDASTAGAATGIEILECFHPGAFYQCELFSSNQSCSCQTSTSSIATGSSHCLGSWVNVRLRSMNENLTCSGQARRLVCYRGATLKNPFASS